MNREIKFRAWDGQQMQKVEILGLSPTDAFSYPEKRSYLHNCQEWDGVDGYIDAPVLMQFTGLKDKNGVEIYEGDLVQCRASSGKVTAAVVYEPALGFGLRDFSSGLWQGQLGRKERPEVVGNIYEK